MAAGLIGGITMYLLQVYAFYQELPPEDVTIQLTLVATGDVEEITVSNLQAIDATSSPLRFRACFETPHSQAMLTETYQVHARPVPLTGPGWFDCYDAEAIGAALEAEQAIAYLAQAEIRDGVDRIVAVFDDGRAFAWHQLNEKFSE